MKTQPIEQLETKNTSLILDQNRQLLQYNKKLKGYLIKSFKAIEKTTELQNQNNELRNENQELKRENWLVQRYELDYETGKNSSKKFYFLLKCGKNDKF